MVVKLKDLNCPLEVLPWQCELNVTDDEVIVSNSEDIPVCGI